MSPAKSGSIPGVRLTLSTISTPTKAIGGSVLVRPLHAFVFWPRPLTGSRNDPPRLQSSRSMRSGSPCPCNNLAFCLGSASPNRATRTPLNSSAVRHVRSYAMHCREMGRATISGQSTSRPARFRSGGVDEAPSERVSKRCGVLFVHCLRRDSSLRLHRSQRGRLAVPDHYPCTRGCRRRLHLL